MLWLIGLGYVICGLISCGIYYGDDDMQQDMPFLGWLLVFVFWLPIWALGFGMAISRGVSRLLSRRGL